MTNTVISLCKLFSPKNICDLTILIKDCKILNSYNTLQWLIKVSMNPEKSVLIYIFVYFSDFLPSTFFKMSWQSYVDDQLIATKVHFNILRGLFLLCFLPFLPYFFPNLIFPRFPSFCVNSFTILSFSILYSVLCSLGVFSNITLQPSYRLNSLIVFSQSDFRVYVITSTQDVHNYFCNIRR